MLIPFRVSYKNAVSETIITYKSVEPDVDIPDSFFEPRTRVD
jgi:outer membrane lipoprotein-sorting protein